MEKKANTTNRSFPLPPKKKNTGWKKWVKMVWMAFFASIAGIVVLFFAVSQGFLGEMPEVKQLENPDIYVASEIISADGVKLGSFEKEKTLCSYDGRCGSLRWLLHCL